MPNVNKNAMMTNPMKIKKSSKFKRFLYSLICVRQVYEVNIIADNIDDTYKESEELDQSNHYSESLLHVCNNFVNFNGIKNENASKSVSTQTHSLNDEIHNLINTPSQDLESKIVLKDKISYFGDHKTTFKIKEFKNIVSHAINPIIVEYFRISDELNASSLAEDWENVPGIEKSLTIFERITEIVNKMNGLINQEDILDSIRKYKEFLNDSKKKYSKITEKKIIGNNKNLPVKEIFSMKDGFFDLELQKYLTFYEISEQCFCLNSLNINNDIRQSNGDLLNFDNISYETKKDFAFFVCHLIFNFVLKEKPDFEYNNLNKEIMVKRSKTRASNFCRFYKHINESKMKLNKVIPE